MTDISQAKERDMYPRRKEQCVPRLSSEKNRMPRQETDATALGSPGSVVGPQSRELGDTQVWLLGSMRSLGVYSEDSGGCQGGNSHVLFAFVSTFVGSWTPREAKW